ncbi:MAG TPA: protein kinase [Acidobacteriaceae bacterium]|nr:protein kinase [Acidobacteriaceae bacterium]
MTTDRWTQIEEIFQGALERPPTDRKQYLEAACGGDQELRAEIDSLLKSDEDAESVLSSLVANNLDSLAQDSGLSESGRLVGPYRLVRELDSGGMGAVYLAVRSDDQYFQIVAIKMVRKGMESPELMQRFRRERQILATLTHPNIGAILDGGETEDGRPFLVMEYVEGQPITLASESRGLTIRERVELFCSVCSAVQFAHQKLVIHRDIKPSNVLVTPDGVIKLIDFGISKPVTDDYLTGDPTVTATGQRLMTPDYASPEQVVGQPLTTSTDIYSLGVLLFELLTASRPYTLHDLSPAAAERLLLKGAIRKPSSVETLSKRIRAELKGDLDRIVLMALEQDPSRRYVSAQHLEEDLRRYLQGRPVLARKSTAIYRTSKYVQRHKTAVAMVCVTVVVLMSAVLVDVRRSRRADRQVKQVAALADSAISDVTEKLLASPASVDTQAALFHSVLRHLDQLRQSSGNDPRLLLELSKAYERVGDLEGSPFVANLGNSGTAITSYLQSLRTANEAHARMPGNDSTRAVIEADQRLGGLEAFLGNVKEAQGYYAKSRFLAEGFWQQDSGDPVRQRLLAMSYGGIGDVQLSSLRPDKALESYRKAFQIFGSEPDGNEDHDRTLVGLYLRMARALNELGPQQEALADVHKARDIAEKLALQSPSSKQLQRIVFTTYQNAILILSGRDFMNVGDSSEAQIYARKATGIAETIAANDEKNVQARYDVSLAYSGLGDSFRLVQPAMAARFYRRSIALTKKLLPLYGAEARHWLAERDEGLAEVLVDRKQAREKLQLLQEAHVFRKELAETSAHGQVHLLGSYCKLSNTELEVGNLPQARRYAEAALPLLNEFTPDSPSLLVLREMGLCYERIGNVQQASARSRSVSAVDRQNAKTEAHRWYLKSAAIWSEFSGRRAANPESEAERQKVEDLLRATE